MREFRGGFTARLPLGDSHPGAGGMHERNPLADSQQLRHVAILRLQGVACLADEGPPWRYPVEDEGYRNVGPFGNVQGCPDGGEVKECRATRDEHVLCGPGGGPHRLIRGVRGRINETQVRTVRSGRLKEGRKVFRVRGGHHGCIFGAHARPRQQTPLRIQIEEHGANPVVFSDNCKIGRERGFSGPALGGKACECFHGSQKVVRRAFRRAGPGALYCRSPNGSRNLKGTV